MYTNEHVNKSAGYPIQNWTVLIIVKLNWSKKSRYENIEGSVIYRNFLTFNIVHIYPRD